MVLQVKYLPRSAERETPIVAPPVWPTLVKFADLEEVHPLLRRIVRDLIAGAKPWPLFLWGEAGSGKTCAATCLLRNSGAGAYATAADLCQAFADAQFGRIAFEEYGASRRRTVGQLWKEWTGGNVCCLDELDSREHPSEHAREIVVKAVNLRVDAGKPLVAIANDDLDGVAAIWGDRVASRLSSGTWYELNGDRRLAGSLRFVGDPSA